jgi:hypothetical protein
MWALFMIRNVKKQRPVNLDLKTIRFPVTAIASILHRVSGVITFVAVGILLWLLEKSGETGIEEGCLSIPEQRALVPRAEKIKIRALDRDGKPFELEADDLLAICIQHEMDHLVGKLFIDYLSPMKQQRIRQKVEKLDRLRARA